MLTAHHMIGADVLLFPVSTFSRMAAFYNRGVLLKLSNCADPVGKRFFGASYGNCSSTQPTAENGGVRDRLQTNRAGGIEADVVTADNFVGGGANRSAARAGISRRKKRGLYSDAEAKWYDEPRLRSPLPSDWLLSNAATQRDFRCQLSAHIQWRLAQIERG